MTTSPAPSILVCLPQDAKTPIKPVRTTTSALTKYAMLSVANASSQKSAAMIATLAHLTHVTLTLDVCIPKTCAMTITCAPLDSVMLLVLASTLILIVMTTFRAPLTHARLPRDATTPRKYARITANVLPNIAMPNLVSVSSHQSTARTQTLAQLTHVMPRAGVFTHPKIAMIAICVQMTNAIIMDNARTPLWTAMTI
jgi:hypothetical protein